MLLITRTTHIRVGSYRCVKAPKGDTMKHLQQMCIRIALCSSFLQREKSAQAVRTTARTDKSPYWVLFVSPLGAWEPLGGIKARGFF